MSEDQGRYDTESEAVCRQTGAAMVVLMVVGGRQGSGFSVSCRQPEMVAELPQLLRLMADNIEAQTKKNPSTACTF